MRKLAHEIGWSMKHGFTEAALQLDLTPKQVRFRVIFSIIIIIPACAIALAFVR
jgi:hypothetical protein